MAEFTEYPIKDLGRGIDTFTPPDSVEDGMMTNIRNMDPKSNTEIETRKGHQRYYGGIPLRANKVSKSGTKITLEFDSSQTISLANSQPGPLVVYGKLPYTDGLTNGGDLRTSFRTIYYPEYTLAFREVYPAGNPATKVVSAAITGITEPYIFVGISEATSNSDASNAQLTPEDIRIDEISYETQLDYEAEDPFPGYFYYLAVPVQPGKVFQKSITTGSGTVINIPSAEHGLSTLNFIVKIFQDAGSFKREITPQKMTISNTGTLSVDLDLAINGQIVIYATNPLQSYNSATMPGSNTITVPNVTEPFNFVGLWATIAGVKTAVEPASISWDSVLKSMSIEYYLGDASENVDIYYTPASFAANLITLEDTTGVSETYTVENPQVSVWGIPHEGIYKSGATQGGWTNHLDTYRSDLTAKVVTGLGGNLFQGLSRGDAGTTYLMPEYRIRGTNRISGDTRLAPIFQGNINMVTRTRGLVRDDSITTDGAKVTAVTFVSPGVVDVTCSFVGKTGTVAFGDQVETGDSLTVVNTGKRKNSGTFDILGVVSDSSTETVFRVANPLASGAQINESGISARANTYTDKALVVEPVVFTPGDLALSTAYADSRTIGAAFGNTIFFKDLRSYTILPDGLNLFAGRTSELIPLASDTAEGVANLVPGDSLYVDSLARRMTVRSVNVNPTTSGIPIVVASELATVTLTNHNLNQGMPFLLTDELSPTGLAGQHVVAEVLSSDSFTFETTAVDGNYTATMTGKTVEIDEELSYASGPLEMPVGVDGRWVTIENPESIQVRTPQTKERHFDENPYASQPYLKSSMVTDSLYLTNGADEVKKFDGSTLYNAGILPWQGFAFVGVSTAVGSLPGGRKLAYTAVSLTDKYFEAAVPAFKVGDRFREPVTGNVYNVVLVETDTSGTPVKYRAYVAETINGATASTGTLAFPNRHRYYVKISALDSNRNIISSATLGGDDLYVDLFGPSTPTMKLLPYPAFQELDYDRLEIETYRTKANTAAPFFRTRRSLVDYSSRGGYLVIQDTVPDDALGTGDLDPAISVLTGGELGNQWDCPPKAKAVTTASNRLIGLNIKSPPTLDLAFRKLDTVASTSISDYSTLGMSITNLMPTISYNSNNQIELQVAATPRTITAGTVLTDQVSIQSTAHGLNPGIWVYLFKATLAEDNLLDFAGWYRVASVTDANNFILDIPHNRALGAFAAGDVNRFVKPNGLAQPNIVPVWLGVDGNYLQYRFSTLTTESLVALRMSIALNAAMTSEQPGNAYWAGLELTPSPWLRAQSGKSFADGRLQICQADAPSGQLGVYVYGLSPSTEFYCNNIRYGNFDAATSEIRLFPSRMVRSYPNFPEIFDNPYGDGGDSVIDIDPADGQEALFAVPFFGTSAFGAANLAQSVVVFKANSIHLVNVETGEKQKLQTNGQGCTSPQSVAVTKDGIFFTNRSGIYKLGWDMSIRWIGRPLKGFFDDEVDLGQLAGAAGHNYAQDRKYKLSLTVKGETKNTHVVVYDPMREELGQPGSWTIYDGIDATGWCNLLDNAYWGSTRGLVFGVRNTGEKYDYREDSSPVPPQLFATGGMDFGLPGQRKVTAGVTLHLRNPYGTLTDVDLQAEQSLSGVYLDAKDVTTSKVESTFRFSLPDRKGTHLRIKVSKAGSKDEKLIISKMAVSISAYGTPGVPQQASSKGS